MMKCFDRESKLSPWQPRHTNGLCCQVCHCGWVLYMCACVQVHMSGVNGQILKKLIMVIVMVWQEGHMQQAHSSHYTVPLSCPIVISECFSHIIIRTCEVSLYQNVPFQCFHATFLVLSIIHTYTKKNFGHSIANTYMMCTRIMF